MVIAMKRKGQIAIWIIIALIIMVAIAIIFVFQEKLSLVKQDEFSPQRYMRQCIEDNVDTAIKQMLPQGGFIDPEHYKLYNGTKVAYLCYNQGYFAPCITQHPIYLTEMENEINVYAEPKVSACYDALKLEMEKRNAVVTYGPLNVNSTLIPGKAVLTVNRSASIILDQNAQNFDSFSVESRSKLYDLGRVAIEIGNQEAQYCYFDYLGYMLLHQEIEISKDLVSDDTKIYTLKDTQTEEKLRIAIKGCSIPAGL
jgi:hypothetical protein